MKVLVIGGVAAGTKAAAKLKREDPSAEVLLLNKGANISYAGCGLQMCIRDSPYGMEKFQLDELAGEDLDMRFDVYRSTWILWSGDMEEPVTVEKPCSSLDILPTLSNLFGLEYDSRLLMGRDVFSQSPALVVLSDRSFITDLGLSLIHI